MLFLVFAVLLLVFVSLKAGAKTSSRVIVLPTSTVKPEDVPTRVNTPAPTNNRCSRHN